MEALKNGIESNFVWNIEQAGSMRNHRILQKRGVVVDAEDYTQMLDTYPEHPLSKIKPNAETFQELKSMRRSFNIKDLSNKKEIWDKANPSHVDQQFIISEYLVEKPSHTSMSEIKSQRNIQARLKNGLQETTNDIKTSPLKLSTKYVPSPEVITKVQLEKTRKDAQLKQLSEKAERNQLNEVARLKLKEECVYI
jgi:hypothetical protein